MRFPISIVSSMRGSQPLPGAARRRSDPAAIYETRRKLLVGNVGDDEAHLRAVEWSVNEYRRCTGADLETAKRVVLAAIAKRKRRSERRPEAVLRTPPSGLFHSADHEGIDERMPEPDLWELRQHERLLQRQPSLLGSLAA